MTADDESELQEIELTDALMSCASHCVRLLSRYLEISVLGES